MAQDKKVFTGGMDKDSDPRLIKGGDYRDALNIRNVSSSDSTSGSVENIEGNTLVPFKFIDEVDQLIEITSTEGNQFIDEIDTSQVFNQVTIDITGKESPGNIFNFSLGYLTPSNTQNLIEFSPISWPSNPGMTSTSTALYNSFGPGGPLYEIHVDDIDTGLPVILVAEINFTEGDVFNGSTFSITYTCTQAGANFSLSANSSYSGPGIIFGSVALSDPIDIAQQNGSPSAAMNISGSVSTVNSTVDLGSNVDDQGNSFGAGGAINTGGTIIDLEISGSSPTSASEAVVDDVILFSYTQAGGDGSSESDWLVEPVIDLGAATESFGSGGEFEFDSGQDSIAGFLTAIVEDEDKFNNILVDGGNGTVTGLGDISTNFLEGTKLQGNNSNIGRNNPSEVSYSQLEYYYDNTEVIEGDGFTIDEGTLTFSGTDILSGNTYPLKSSIIEDKAYLLSFTVAGLVSGLSLNFNIGNQEFTSVEGNGIKTLYITPENNSSIIYITFNKDFTSSNEVVITNLRLFLEDVPVNVFSIRLASIGSTRFNLAFSSSEGKLKNALSAGKQSTQVREWFPGVALSLVTKNIGDGYGVIAGVQLAELQEALLEAEQTITALWDQINSISDEHDAELNTLTSQLAEANSDLTRVKAELTAALALNEVLQLNLDALQGYVSAFLTAQQSGDELATVDAYISTIEGSSSITATIMDAIIGLSTTTVVDPQTQIAIDDYILQITDLQSQLDAQSLVITSQNDIIIAMVDAHNAITVSLIAADDSLTKLNISQEHIDSLSVSELIAYMGEHAVTVSALTSGYIDLAANLQSELDIIVPEDGVSQSDVDVVQALLDAVVPEDGVSQSDVDAVQALLDAIVPEDGVHQSDVDVVQALLDAIVPEDGISQADLDAVEAALNILVTQNEENEAYLATVEAELIATNLTLDAIYAEEAANPSVIDLTEHLLDGDFSNPGSSDWGLGLSHDTSQQNLHATGGTTFTTQNFTPVSAGDYIISVNVTDYKGGRISMSLYTTDYTKSTSLPFISSEGRHIFNVNLDEGTSIIYLNTSTKGLSPIIDLTVDDISIVSASSSTGVTASTIENLLAFTEELKDSNDALIEGGEAIGVEILQLESELSTANANIDAYSISLSSMNTSIAGIGSAILNVISELSITSTITQEDIDDFITSYDINNLNLSEQTTGINELITYLVDQIALLEGSSPTSNETNTRWMLTFSGAVPVSPKASNTPYMQLAIKNSKTGDTNLLALPIVSLYSTTNAGRAFALGSSSYIQESLSHNGSPVMLAISRLNELSGYSTYTQDLKLQSDPTQYITSPAVFIVPVDVNGEVEQLKFTAHNFNFQNLLIDENEDPFFGSAVGSQISHFNTTEQVLLGDRGSTPIAEDDLQWLSKRGVNSGIQLEVEALGGTSDWGLYITSNNDSGTLITNQFTQELFNTGSDDSYRWRIGGSDAYDSESNTHLSGYQSLTLNATIKNPVGVGSRSIETSQGSAESFVAAAAAPNFSIDKVRPKVNLPVNKNTPKGDTSKFRRKHNDELIYPSKKSDIILVKSRDLRPNLTGNIFGAKRFVRNKILKKTTAVDNSSSSYKCIGTYEDKPKNSIYYFVHNSDKGEKFDCILEYSLIDNEIRTVYQDGRQGSNGLSEGILNFDLDHAITGVNKVDDILYWTDNLNRPRKINVSLGKNNEVNISKAIKFKDVNFPGGHDKSVFLTYNDIALKSKYSIGDAVYTHTNSGEEATSYNGYAEVLGIVRRMPAGLTFNTTDTSTTVISSVALTSSQLEVGEWIGIMDSANFPRFYQVDNISGSTITTVSPVTFTLTAAKALFFVPGSNIGGLLTNCPFQSFGLVPGIIMSADPSDAYSPLISFGKYEDKMRYFDVIKHQPLKRPVTELVPDTSYAKNNILDTLFQFKYRYSHQDNENTSYSGVSNINIDPEFARNTPLTFTEYKNTANTIEVEYFDTISDVKKIEITTRKGNDGEFTLVDTVQNNFIRYLKSLKNEVIVDPDYFFDIPKSIIKFRNNGVYPFIDKSEGDNLFDAVPKLAKAQTIISDNRLTYGNILEGYDNTPLVVSSSFDAEGPIIETTSSNIAVYSTTGTSLPVTTFSTTNTSSANNSSIASAINSGSSGNNWGDDGGQNCNVVLYIELAGLNLNNVDSQTLSLNLEFGLQRKLIGGRSRKRSGRFNMNIDITGLETFNEVRNEIINQAGQGNYEGGLDISFSAANFNGDDGTITVTPQGSRVKVKFHFIDNDLTDEIGNWNVGWNEWEYSRAVINTKLLSGDAGFNTFKTGAFHDFGISYFDETNRCSFVNVAPDYGNDVILQEGYNTTSVYANLNGTRPYNYFPTETNGPAIGQTSGLKLSIYNKPPSWATSYQVMYAGNTSVDDFMQVTVPHVIPGVGGDTQMYLSLQSLKSHKASYTEATGALTDFDVAKGDRIRFISCDTTSGRKKFNDYLDFEITGFDYYNEEDADVDGNPIDIAAGQGGFYIRIANPGSTLAQTEGGDVSINHSGFSLSGSGYDKLIAELYRPKKTQTPENLVYFELGDRLEIGNPGEANNYHAGIEDQGNDYFYDKDVNTMVSLVPAVININQGDIYIKSRNMFTVTDGASLESFPCESYYLNDFHSTNHYDKGRINVVNNNSKERNLGVSVYYSEPYVSTGAINGLSSFNLANSPYFDYNKEFGSIQSLHTKDNDLIIFHESKVGRVLVGKDILNTASGEGLVSLSNNVISNYVSLYAGQFGCGLNPESIVKHGQKFYFADIKRGAILRLSTDGLTVISEYGMKDYFRDLGEMYIKYNPDGIKTFSDSIVGGGKTIVPYLLVGGYDPKYDEYIITFPEISAGGRNYVAGNASTIKNWSDGILNWDDATLDPNMKNNKVIFNAVTLGFSEGTNKWTSFYSFVPDFYSKINKQFVSFKQGRVYRHNDSDLYSRARADFNNFYGNGNLSYIDFVFNADPSSVKSYNAIGLESDTKFITGMFTNTGQHYGNYDDVATTSIAFKKVDGLVTGTAGSNLITGSGTEFYESVTPGDLVRVFGYEKGTYVHRDFIVTKVISNTLISVNEKLGIDADNSYMLVIDYKTKEGIQYSSIPFVTSGLSSTGDNFQFGDGSEIQGVGVGTGIDTSSAYVLFSEVGNVDLNKSISLSQMVVGGEYVIKYIPEVSTFNVSDVDPSVNSTTLGTTFTCKTPSSDNSATVMPTEVKLYVKNLDNTTTFLGYPYIVLSGKVYFVPAPNLNDVFAQANKTGFYFTAKSGEVEGEKMKGSYMRTILATNKSQSKKKFNLYAANADVDKSELSNR